MRFRCTKQLNLFVVLGWVGLGQSADGLGSIGSHKMDPWTTLICIHCVQSLRQYDEALK